MVPESRAVVPTIKRCFLTKPNSLLRIGAGVLVGYVFGTLGTCGLYTAFGGSRHAAITENKKTEAEIKVIGQTRAHRSNEPSKPGWRDAVLDGPLPRAFQAALETHPVIPPAEMKIVLIAAYYRSGSTFVGELLSSGPMTFFHFEPLMVFTVNDRISPRRERYAFDLLDELAMCRMENVPLYMAFFEQRPGYVLLHNRFLADICGDGEACFSPRHVASLCTRAKTQVFKFTRLHVSQVITWIKRHRIQSHIHVVHLVRDPRAIYASRRGLRWCTENTNCGSAESICGQLRSDLDEFEELKREIGPTRTLRLRFEDLAADPVNETVRLYRKLGLDYAPSVLEYLNNHTKATAKDLRDAHSTKRNTWNVADSWKRKLPMNTIASIQKVCNDTLQRLGYQLLQ